MRIIMPVPSLIEKALNILSQLWVTSTAYGNILKAVTADQVDLFHTLKLA